VNSAYQGGFACSVGERRDEIEISVPLRVVEAVADREAVGDLEPT